MTRLSELMDVGFRNKGGMVKNLQSLTVILLEAFLVLVTDLRKDFGRLTAIPWQKKGENRTWVFLST